MANITPIKFYRKDRKKLAKHALVGYSCFGETRMEQDLFGWKIHTQRRVFEFDSELEARYCLIFLELGWRTVLIPTDLNYLAEILPRLEYLKMRADEVIGNGLKRVFGRKIRWDARIKTYQKISIIPDDAPKFETDEFANYDEEEEDLEEDFEKDLEEEFV